MDPKDFERLISGERFKNQAGSMTAEPLGRESYRSESALSGTVAMTPEEKAMDIRTNQNPAVFEELEREYRNAKDPKVKAILGEEIQRQLSQKSGLPAIGGLGLQGSGGAGLVGPAFPRDSRALPDFAGEKSRRDAQAASDESPISTSLGRGWERTKQMAGDTFNLLTGDAEGIRQNALDWQKYDEANPMPTSAKEFSEGHQAAGDSVGAMLKNAAGNLGGLGLSSVEQITNSISSMAGSIALSAVGAAKGFAVGGPLGALVGSMVGGIIGATPGAMMIEPGAKVAEAMAESGVDLANPDAVKSWFSANQGELIEKGLLKAGGVAAVDGLMGGIGQAIVAKPALAFAAAQNRALAKIGVNAGDKAAVAAARQMPEYRALMAQPARDFLEATTVAKNAMRGTASFAAETLGEGTGEYWGEYLAEGEGNFNEAMLESLTAGITSVATTGAQYGASKVLFGPDQTAEEIKALAAIQSQEQKPAAPQPNSPLSNAAEAAKPVDPFAEMLAPITERLNDREIYGKIRGNEALGPDALGDILASYRVATNKNADPMQRQAAIDRLGEFFRAFDNMPNFTQGTPESSGQSSGLPVVAPTQGGGVGFVDPAAGSIDGEARTVADPLSLGDQPRLPAPPRRIPSPPPALIADSREAQRIVAEYEAAYQDLVKADQLGASDQELMQRQINLRNAEARLSELNQFIESRRQQETVIKRDALLSDVLATLQPGQNPLRAFDRALKQSGFTDTNFTEAEKAKIARFMDIAAAQDEQQAIPSAPNEAGDFGIPEKVVSRTPATNAVANMLNAGWQWDGGWNLVSPTGERYNLKAAERQFLKAQAAKTRVRKPIVSPSQQEQANDAALDEGSNQGQRADDAGGQGIARPGGIVPGGLLRGAAAPAQRGGADSALGNANTNGLGALNGLPATQQVAEEAPQANDAQAGAEQGAAPETEGVSDSSLNRDSSWVIRNKETGEVVMETFDKAKVDALNTAKYEAVPVQKYLGSINGKSNAQPTSLPNQGATQAQPPAQAPVVPAAVANQDAAPVQAGRNLAGRTDAQLTHLVTNGSTQEVRTAAKAEIDRRAAAGVPAATVGGSRPAPVLSVGVAPGAAEPVTVKNGVVHIGKYPAQNFDTGEDVTVEEGATDRQVIDALRAADAIAPNMKVFGLREDVDQTKAEQPRQRTGRMTALDDGRIQGYASDLAAMAPEAGWAEEGGKLIRDANGKASRTAWIPRAEWFRAGMINSPSEVEDAVQKAIAGQPMSAKEKRTVQGMMDYLDAMNEVGDGINEELGAIEREGVYDFSEQVQDDVEFGAEIDFENLPAQDEAAALRAMGFTEEDANEVTQGKQGDAAGVRAATDEVSEADAGKNLEDGAGSVAGSQQGREAPEGFDLTGQTSEQAAKQFAQQQDGEDAGPTKAQADRERDAVPFSLAGQSQPKPQGVQAGLFTADGRPSVDATVSPKDQGAAAFSEGKERKAPESFSAADKARWFAGYDDANFGSGATENSATAFTNAVTSGQSSNPAAIEQPNGASDSNIAQTKPGEMSEFERGQAMMAEGIDALVALLGGKINMLPSEEERIIPILSKIFRGAAIMGYSKFADAARFVVETLRSKAPDVAEKISIDNLQAGYINIAAEIGGNKKDALSIESIDGLFSGHEDAKASNAEPEAQPAAEAKRGEFIAANLGVAPGRKKKDVLDTKSDKFWKGETWRDIGQKVIASPDVRLKKEPLFTGNTLGTEATEFDYYLTDGRRIQKIDKEVAEYIETLKAEAKPKEEPAAVGSPNQAETEAKREELQARIETAGREKYAGPADVSSRADQMEMANRAGTIAALKAMNNQLRQIAPDEAWADANIEDAADLDALRDQISQALVDAQRSGKAEANPLRKILEEMSGQELKAVFDEIGLAGKLMSYEERIDALLAEDAAEVRAAIAVVTGESEVRNDMQARIQAAEQQTNHDATPAQKEAGNYAKGKFAWNGLTVSVETAKGEDRTDKETNGDKWRVTMPATYGYILGTVGADKDHVDVFMGDSPESDLVFVVNQNKVDSPSFDEHKVMAGFASAKEARDAYLGSFEDGFGNRVLGSISGPYSVKSFREMLDAGAFSKAKPIGEAISPLSFVDVEVSGEQKPASVAVQEIDDQLSLAKQLLECVLS